MRSFYAIKGKVGTLFKLDVNITLHLFDSLRKPILLDGSDFWGCLKLPKNNPIENLQMAFCKGLIGVQKQTSNLGVLIELGRIPLTIYAKKYCIKNWESIAIKKNSNRLVKTLYEWDLQKKHWMAKNYKRLFIWNRIDGHFSG